jgi:tRNA 5-methylaminomethyl-2-thiouridine biosynthesis bifunctional protein
MKTQPIQPARIEFGDAGQPPRAPEFDDIYHPQVGALAQARHVFLGGNGLPGRWGQRRHFVVVETGFGLGNNFLATWDAWRSDPARCERLHMVSVEKHPLTRVDLQRAHANSPLTELAAELLKAWPPLTPNLHVLEFEGGRVRLTLVLGDVATVLPALRASADAFYLDGFAPARNPAMWQPRVLKALGRMATAGATLATWSVARELRDGLTSAGFEVSRAAGIGGKRDITVARWSPRFTPRRLPTAAVPGARDAVVVGAGIAGAAAARALARAGFAVTVLERHATPAAENSGNLAGLFHGTVNADDGTYARLFRTAALRAARVYAQALVQGRMHGQSNGLLRLDAAPAGLAEMQTLLIRQALPPDYVQALASGEASARAGVALTLPAWFYPGGGWIDPAAWVAQALAEPGVHWRGGVEVGRVLRSGQGWLLADRAGQAVAQASVVVLANAAGAAPLIAPWAPLAWPVGASRGQVTWWRQASGLQCAVAGDGYAIPLPDGVLCGATREDSDATLEGDRPTVREADHRFNIDRLLRLTGLHAPGAPADWQGRAGLRLHADDRLPIAGALPQLSFPPGQRLDQARLLPREPGLFVLTALGSRGLTLAPLLGELVAAMASGTPWPLEQDLADAVDPARWAVRAARLAQPTAG